MGLVSRFFRKKEEEDLEDLPPLESPREDAEEAHFSAPRRTPFQEEKNIHPSFPASSQAFSDMNLILTKLELINQRLEVLDRRVQVIEKIARESQE